jgi:hypothetical protein
MCAFSAPFIYYGQQNKKKNLSLISKIHEVAKGKGALPTEIETWRTRYGFGIDYQQKVLVYVQQGAEEIEKSLRLSDYRKVNLIKTLRELDGKTNSNKLPEYLALELIPKSEKGEIHSLEIYDAEYYSDLLGETVLADKWLEIIKKQLN